MHPARGPALIAVVGLGAGRGTGPRGCAPAVGSRPSCPAPGGYCNHGFNGCPIGLDVPAQVDVERPSAV
jgi:hypothetical protein